jgi:dephospho-CoA kinase
MRRIALTGGIATGKTYVVGRLREAGLAVIDADVLARQAVARGTAGLAAIVERFGPGVLTAEGNLNRPHLGRIVFADELARRDLEAIVHPYVRRGIAEFFGQLPPVTPFAVADIPLLYETHQERHFDFVVVVACAPDIQIERIISRDGLSREDAERRVAAQLPIEEKVRRADYVIRTDGRFVDTDAQIAHLLERWRSPGDPGLPATS